MAEKTFKRLSRRDFLRTTAAASALPALGHVATSVVHAQEPTTIRLTAWGNPTEFTAREETIALFHEVQDAIRVEFIHIPDSYMTKLQTMLAGGDYPDVIYIGNGNVVPLVARGQFEPLDSYIERDMFDTADIFPANLALYNVDGVQYGFPLDAPNQQIFYNVTWFEEKGVPRPSSDWEDESWNWDAFLEAALGLVDRENNKWAFQVKTWFRAWWIWVTSNGGQFYNEDATACLLNEPVAVEAFQFLADLIHVHQVAPPLDVATEMGSSQLFEAGVIAMDTFWPAMGRMRNNIGDKFVWDVAPHPAGKAGKSTAGGGSGQVISAFSENKDAAWEFLKFMAIDRWRRGLDGHHGHRAAAAIGGRQRRLPQARRAAGAHLGLHRRRALAVPGSAPRDLRPGVADRRQRTRPSVDRPGRRSGSGRQHRRADQRPALVQPSYRGGPPAGSPFFRQSSAPDATLCRNRCFQPYNRERQRERATQHRHHHERPAARGRLGA